MAVRDDDASVGEAAAVENDHNNAAAVEVVGAEEVRKVPDTPCRSNQLN